MMNAKEAAERSENVMVPINSCIENAIRHKERFVLFFRERSNDSFQKDWVPGWMDNQQAEYITIPILYEGMVESLKDLGYKVEEFTYNNEGENYCTRNFWKVSW